MKHLVTLLGLIALAGLTGFYSLSPSFPVLEGLDLQGGMRVTLEPDPTKQQPGTTISKQMMEQVRDVLENRVNSFGLSGAEVRLKGANQVLVQLPGAKNPEEALKQLSTVAQLELRHFKNVRSGTNLSGRYTMDRTAGDPARQVPDRYSFTDTVTNQPVEAKKVIDESDKIVTGADLRPTSRAMISSTGSPEITFELKDNAARVFGDFTRTHQGEILAIILDDNVISAPTIESPITDGKGVITGSATMAEARLMANLLNSGSLPFNMRPAEIQVVGATLGQESIDKSLMAGAVGLGLVLVFMLAYYALPGLLACLALLIYAAITFSVFKGIPGITPAIVLDLPGITGFILSVGMAVDANILIFERLKEELRAGKPLHAAVDAGFSRAFTSILDSNVTTWIICTILIWLGAPIIKGFAITLAIGVAVSMFTAITATRTFLHLAMNTSLGRSPKMYGTEIGWLRMIFPPSKDGVSLQVYGKRRVYLGLSAASGAVALLFILATPFGYGLKPGIDFQGGTNIEAAINTSIADPAASEKLRGDVQKVLTDAGVKDATVSIGKSEAAWSEFTVSAEDLAQSDQGEIRTRLEGIRGFDGTGYKPETKDKKFTAVATYVSDTVDEAAIRAALSGRSRDGATLTLKALTVTPRKIDHKGSAAIPVVLINSLELRPEQLIAVREGLGKLGGGLVRPLYQENSIGASVAAEVTILGILSVIVASLAIVVYLAFRFAIGGLINGVKFGTCAVIALVHDVSIVVGLFALMGQVAGWRVDSLFITAALTVLGFSVHDTIVVYDRIRENLHHRLKGETFIEVSDRSITQTFDRSVNTSFTVLLVVAALVIFGGESVRLFNVALLVGIAIGTYSSIFVASPLVVMWERYVQARAGQLEPDSGRAGRRPAPAARASVAAPATTARPADDDTGSKTRTAPAGPKTRRKRRL